MEETLTKVIDPVIYEINYLQCQSGFRTKERFLPTPYFLYVHKGEGTFIIGKTAYACKEGDLFFCPFGVPNTIIADEKSPYLLSGIDFDFSDETVPIKPNISFKEHINVSGNVQFFWLTMELIKLNAIKDDSYYQYMQTIFKAWLLLVSNLGENSVSFTVAENIAAYLLANCERDVSLKEVAKEFGYHPNHINRLIKQRFKTTLMQYHSDLRIKKAMQLLSFSNYSISEISNICGYQDTSYFSRIFKQKTTWSPLQYRNKNA